MATAIAGPSRIGLLAALLPFATAVFVAFFVIGYSKGLVRLGRIEGSMEAFSGDETVRVRTERFF